MMFQFVQTLILYKCILNGHTGLLYRCLCQPLDAVSIVFSTYGC